MKVPVIWTLWIALTLIAGGIFAHTIVRGEDKSTFVIGPATHGHYQIELACSTCHQESFGGDTVLQDACTQCHAADLKEAHDSHPKSKFTDPRNADRLSVIDARLCISCHTEHQLEYTNAMGVTLPDDFCFHCHEDLGEERASHKGLSFDTCASAGCHNYHDNRALYEDFLFENVNQNWLLNDAPPPKLPRQIDVIKKSGPLSIDTSQSVDKIQQYPEVADEWQHSSHAIAGVDCHDCHVDKSNSNQSWIERPNIQQCKSCHEFQADTFTQGKHGMRLSPQLSRPLSPMTPARARQPFHQSAHATELTCNTCHGAHAFSPEFAAVDVCLDCHNDQHSQNYLPSPHAAASSSTTPSAPVTCADCHMPSVQAPGPDGAWATQHNQNWNLRPNEKMIRSVCLDCHGLQFTLDALADKALIQNNFSGRPATAVPSIDWAVKRHADPTNLENP